MLLMSVRFGNSRLQILWGSSAAFGHGLEIRSNSGSDIILRSRLAFGVTWKAEKAARLVIRFQYPCNVAVKQRLVGDPQDWDWQRGLNSTGKKPFDSGLRNLNQHRCFRFLDRWLAPLWARGPSSALWHRKPAAATDGQGQMPEPPECRFPGTSGFALNRIIRRAPESNLGAVFARNTPSGWPWPKAPQDAWRFAAGTTVRRAGAGAATRHAPKKCSLLHAVIVGDHVG